VAVTRNFGSFVVGAVQGWLWLGGSGIDFPWKRGAERYCWAATDTTRTVAISAGHSK
jgi:hypothetical protein